jgi:LPS O-antigen subunit length determinant protein (WzzB/FepE family)
MDIDPTAYVDEDAAAEVRKSRLNSRVAVSVALLATFVGICKVKDDNIVQAMQQAQADKVDHWSFYQARNIREEIARAELTQVRVQALTAAPAARPLLDSVARTYAELTQREHQKKADVQRQAEDDQMTYDALNVHDDQFDLSDALLAIAISLLALTSLTQKRWLFWLAMLPVVIGVVFGLAGLLGWGLHSDALARALS